MLGLQREANLDGQNRNAQTLVVSGSYALLLVRITFYFALITQSSEDGPELMPFSTKFVS